MRIAERPYRDDDLPRLQSAVAAWVRAAGPCGYAHPGDLFHRIYPEIRGRRPRGELVRVWEDGAAIVGVAICLRFDTAFDLFVDPALRAGPAERAMLHATYARARRLALGAGAAAVTSDVFACDTARRTLLEGMGFRQFRVWDHVVERSLAEQPPAPAPPPGFTVRRAAHADAAQLAAVHNSAFGAAWTPEAYRDEVMLQPGYTPDHEIVVAAPDGRLAAFTVLAPDPLNRVGLFEPVGTHAEFRRLGLARAMMLFGLAELRAMGMATARLAHAADNQPALALYRSLGFAPRYETLGYTIDIAPEPGAPAHAEAPT